ncbi:MAG: hypothetical protein AAGA54_13755 [Myxococcota bacterium]
MQCCSISASADQDPSTWCAEHQPIIDAWLLTQGIDPMNHDHVRSHAALMVVSVPTFRAESEASQLAAREPFSWAEVDAFEVLIGNAALGGCGLLDPADYVAAMGDFAEHLGALGIIPPAEATALTKDWPIWAARLLDLWEVGGRWLADGTYVDEAELERRRHAWYNAVA